MLFNSLVFFQFFAVFYAVYWLTNRRLRLRNAFLLLASYFFYGCWDWRFLSLIVFSTIVDFVCGAQIHASDDQRRRRLFMTVSVVTNLGLLGTFKYFDFFVSSFADLFGIFGIQWDHPTLHIILPVGISFYTFQTLTYTIDIYRRELEPSRSFLNFAAFVAFFPQLVAGPIERASALLPQIARRASFSYLQSRDGLFLLLWGLFKKVMIADRLSTYVDIVYANPDTFGSMQAALATLFFAIQIYCDFSGYSDMARGLAKLLGIDLMINFSTPYLAVSLKDFWRRWHISLSTWFRDYLYIPLGGSRSGLQRHRINLLATFVVSGFWHGAAYNFIVWGFLHGAMQMVDPFSRARTAGRPFARALQNAIGWATIFLFVNLTWVFFRASSFGDAVTVLRKLGQLPHAVAGLGASGPGRDIIVGMSGTDFFVSLYLVGLLAAVDIAIKDKQIDRFAAALPTPARWVLAWFIGAQFLLFGTSNAGPFIYFQF